MNSAHVPVKEIWEPAETMVEAGFALITGDPSVLTGRIAYSLQLIVELDIPVYDFPGKNLMEGWQPADVVRNIKADEAFHAGNDWPDVFDFHRVSTPYPDAAATASRAVGVTSRTSGELSSESLQAQRAPWESAVSRINQAGRRR